MQYLTQLIPGYPKLKRSGLSKAIIHNTAGSASAKAEAIRLRAKSQWMNGNAHRFIDESFCITVIPLDIVSYNCGNWNMNTKSISYEVCKSRGDKATFLKAEQNTFKVVAADLKKYGKTTSIVDLHRNIRPTACPHRSQEIHGAGSKCLGYFRKEINKHMATPKSDGFVRTVEFQGANGKLYRFNMYTWDKLLMTLNDGKYNKVIEVVTKGRQITQDGKAVGKYTKNRTVAVRFL